MWQLYNQWPHNVENMLYRSLKLMSARGKVAIYDPAGADFSLSLYFYGRLILYGTARHDTTRHNTARHDKLLFHGFHMLKFTLAPHWQLTTNTVSLGLREENILPVCYLTVDVTARWLFVVSRRCRVVPYNVNRPLAVEWKGNNYPGRKPIDRPTSNLEYFHNNYNNNNN
jgi:hypothetical protein